MCVCVCGYRYFLYYWVWHRTWNPHNISPPNAISLESWFFELFQECCWCLCHGWMENSSCQWPFQLLSGCCNILVAISSSYERRMGAVKERPNPYLPVSMWNNSCRRGGGDGQWSWNPHQFTKPCSNMWESFLGQVSKLFKKLSPKSR